VDAQDVFAVLHYEGADDSEPERQKGIADGRILLENMELAVRP
jgi:hypothetical protein